MKWFLLSISVVMAAWIVFRTKETKVALSVVESEVPKFSKKRPKTKVREFREVVSEAKKAAPELRPSIDLPESKSTARALQKELGNTSYQSIDTIFQSWENFRSRVFEDVGVTSEQRLALSEAEENYDQSVAEFLKIFNMTESWEARELMSEKFDEALEVSYKARLVEILTEEKLEQLEKTRDRFIRGLDGNLPGEPEQGSRALKW